MTGGRREEAPDSLIVGAHLDDLRRVGVWVHAWSRRHHVPAGTAARLDLCSTEVVTNIMTHARPGGAPPEICLRLDRQDERLSLEIADDGTAFDPRQAGEPPRAASLEEARIGGWGLRLVRGLSDELRYRREAGRNHLTLIFRLPPT